MIWLNIRSQSAIECGRDSIPNINCPKLKNGRESSLFFKWYTWNKITVFILPITVNFFQLFNVKNNQQLLFHTWCQNTSGGSLTSNTHLVCLTKLGKWRHSSSTACWPSKVLGDKRGNNLNKEFNVLCLLSVSLRQISLSKVEISLNYWSSKLYLFLIPTAAFTINCLQFSRNLFAQSMLISGRDSCFCTPSPR